MKNILTKKAMTLFELLAVIVILGIILAIGFPTATRLINNSRKDAFAANVNSYISAAKTAALTEWAARDSAVDVVYYISGEKPNVGDGENVIYEQENFGISALTAGAVRIIVKNDGTIDSITMVTKFSNGTYTLKDNTGVSTPITRANVEDSKAGSED